MRGFRLFVVFLPSGRSGPSRSTIADKAEAREADQPHRPGLGRRRRPSREIRDGARIPGRPCHVGDEGTRWVCNS